MKNSAWEQERSKGTPRGAHFLITPCFFCEVQWFSSNDRQTDSIVENHIAPGKFDWKSGLAFLHHFTLGGRRKGPRSQIMEQPNENTGFIQGSSVEKRMDENLRYF